MVSKCEKKNKNKKQEEEEKKKKKKKKKACYPVIVMPLGPFNLLEGSLWGPDLFGAGPVNNIFRGPVSSC